MDGDALTAHIDEKLDGLTSINAEEHCIFKVHEQLLEVNKKAYKPVLLAIGPYNDHGKVGQGLMEEHKLRYLKQMLQRRSERSVKEYIIALRDLEERARNCYAECISKTKDEFVEMMLLDGCFIIELFRKWETLDLRDDQLDPIFQLDWMLPKIARDLLLFENQLPFFILTKLSLMIESSQTPLPNQSEHLGEHTIEIKQKNEITCLESSTSIEQSVQIRRFVDLALSFFYGSLPFQWNVNGSSSYSIKDTKHLLSRPHKAITPLVANIVYEHLQVGDKFKNANFKHLLDLIHTIIRLSVLDMELHRAKKCQEVGVKFKKGEIFKILFGLISGVASPLLGKMANMKLGCKKKSRRYAIELEKSKLPYTFEDWNSVPYGAQLQEAGVKFEMAEKFRDKFVENFVWKLTTPDAIAFQEAEIELEKAKEFLDLPRRNRNEEDEKELCPITSKMVEKFMRLPFLNKIENWKSIPNGREFKEAGVNFKKAKKFRDTKNVIKPIPNARELKEGGVKFKKAKQHTTFAIQFSNGELEISPLTIEDETETFLRNLIAYEQYDPNMVSSYVIDYMCFMDDLIDSPKDVELLRRKGIIENRLGKDAVVSTMFNKLGHHVGSSPSNSIYVKTSIEMNKHCAKRWNVWMAKLRHNYFNSPWALLSVLAAILLLGLAITQTVFSIIH
ncbi:uncharacterized protein LOC122316474 [Carya illinoinensis]|uniref:uncharacterized protein LOC122316474 n=1 Tax=Carya illinoinensis TaxID=32201 RepID=UPI001C71A615|nr:uncharacterized protein LOC122316474 [Carya illinoinensis]